MVWRTATFLDALKAMLHEFDNQPAAQALALVWRTGGEYNVMDTWMLMAILNQMDEKRLRVVLWLTREEAAKLISIINEVI